ncbi:IgGFc-binding protein-like [Mercenaria mercenaria]|uniref:IgGFc-binding protein-like n=1 Tax=Mercenaria mercenaria TaxID=6596 RepID=UPI00234F71B6|nr:IgGFc-binding protein-like [Mercenaria mercenaria]
MVPMYSHYNPDMTFDIASNSSGQLRLYIPFLNINRTKTLNNGHTTLTVSNQLISRGNFTEKRGIRIQTDVPVAVFVTLYLSGLTESYLALPVSFAGKSYMLAAFEPYNGAYSEALVVSSFTNTIVNITTKRQMTSSESLNWLDAKQIAETNDISGTDISANANVSVIAGTTCAHVPHNYTYDCGFIVEQLIPTNAWEKEYIVPNMPPRTGVLIRVLAHKNQDVCFYTQRGSTCKQVLNPQPLEFSTGSEPVVVRSNTTISVMSYGVQGGPFMTVVPGIKNFMNEYHFVVPSTYSSFNNSLAVVIQSAQSSGLILDGASINSIKHMTSTCHNHLIVTVSLF